MSADSADAHTKKAQAVVSFELHHDVLAFSLNPQLQLIIKQFIQVSQNVQLVQD